MFSFLKVGMSWFDLQGRVREGSRATSRERDLLKIRVQNSPFMVHSEQIRRGQRWILDFSSVGLYRHLAIMVQSLLFVFVHNRK